MRRIAIVFLVVSALMAEAQSFYAIRRPRNLTFYGGTGTANYLGDLVNPGTVGKVRYNLVVGANYLMHPRFTLRSELTWFRIAGSDKNADDDRVTRNLSFFSNNQELNVNGTFNIIPEPKKFYSRSVIIPFVTVGAALLHFNPKAEYNGKNYALQPLETEGKKYSRFTWAIPVGGGIKLRIDPIHNIVLEAGFRFTNNDHLDDISKKRYPDPTSLSSDLARALSDRRQEVLPEGENPLPFDKGVRGNPKNPDHYMIFNIKYEYYFPKTIFGDGGLNRQYRKKRKAFR